MADGWLGHCGVTSVFNYLSFSVSFLDKFLIWATLMVARFIVLPGAGYRSQLPK